MVKWLKHSLMVLIILPLLWGGGFVWFAETLPVMASEDNRKVDAIVVLTGGGQRIEHGLSLLLADKAPLLFVSGVDDGIMLSSLLKGVANEELISRVPHERIELGYYAHSTLQNAEEVKFWVNKHHIKSIRLVTANYHMTRSLYELQQVLPELLIIPDPVFPAEFATHQWWQPGYAMRLVLSEYHKYMASRLVHMLGIISE